MNSVKYMHTINNSGKGGVCIAYQVLEKRNENKQLISRELRIASSFCSDKDVYSKKIGREKAYNNITTGNYFSMPIKGTLAKRRKTINAYLHYIPRNLQALFQGY